MGRVRVDPARGDGTAGARGDLGETGKRVDVAAPDSAAEIVTVDKFFALPSKRDSANALLSVTGNAIPCFVKHSFVCA